jgi:hypothetical protein
MTKSNTTSKHKCPISIGYSFEPLEKLPPMVGMTPEQANQFGLRYDQKVLLCTECSTVYQWIDRNTIRVYGHFDERIPPREFVPLPNGPEDEFFD